MGTPLKKVKQILRWCTTTTSSDEGKDFPVQQVSYSGKEGDAIMWFPYGYHAIVPKDSLGVMLNLGSEPSDRIVLTGSPAERPAVAAGEVVMYHPVTGSKVHFLADGSIDINSDVGEVNIHGTTKVNISSSGPISVESEVGGIDITAKVGNVDVTTNLGDVSVTANVGNVNVNSSVGNVILSNGVLLSDFLVKKSFLAVYDGHEHVGSSANVKPSDQSVPENSTLTAKGQ